MIGIGIKNILIIINFGLENGIKNIRKNKGNIKEDIGVKELNPGNERKKIMSEKIEIIYDFNGYADPKIENVELTQVNGYRTKIIKGSEEKMIYKLKNLTDWQIKRILI
ncbi:hypothetical protein ES705_43652 [subsurface metagenome]